jgi:hypothetical protein
MDPVTVGEALDSSESLHLPCGSVPPPAEVVFGFCRRIGSTPDILYPDDAIPRVSAELGVDEAFSAARTLA